MSQLRIVVCDDDPKQAESWKQEIEGCLGGSAEIDVLAENQIPELANALAASKQDDSWSPAKELKDVGIFIVDHDLGQITPQVMTAEDLANLARLYSGCEVIVILNQRPEVDFDLTLKGNPMSRADLHLNDRVIGNPGLWIGNLAQDFRPWMWPNLVDAVGKYGQRRNQLEGRLDQKIITEFFKFPNTAIDRLSRSSIGFLHPKKNASEITFRDFVTESTNAIDKRDRDKITENDDAIIRVAAARVHMWLESFILAAEDILVDVPHLVERMPFLIKGNRQKIASWDATVSLRRVKGINSDLVDKKYKFEHEAWLSRPAFWWTEIERDTELSDRRWDDEVGNLSDFVFLEDVSRFGPRADAQEFVAAFHSAFDRRYVSKAAIYDESGMNYAPQQRLALA